MGWRKKEETISVPEIPKVVPVDSKEKLEDEIKRLKEEITKIKDVPDIEPKIKEVVKSRIIVVKELPMQEVRTTKDKDGTIINFITIEEALSNIMNS